MKLDFVEANGADLGFFIHVHHTAYRNTMETMFGWDETVQDDFATRAFKQGGIQIILSAGQRVGVVGYDRNADHIWLKELFILPSKQGVGIGTAVVQHVKALAEEYHIPIKLRTLRANKGARALYERNGFVVSCQTDDHWNMICR